VPSATLVSPFEYLSTAYRPDRDLLDGHLVPRNVGEYDHSNLPGTLVAFASFPGIKESNRFLHSPRFFASKCFQRTILRGPDGVLEIPSSEIRIPLDGLFRDLE